METTVTRSGEAMLRIRVTTYRCGPGGARVKWYREAKVRTRVTTIRSVPLGTRVTTSR